MTTNLSTRLYADVRPELIQWARRARSIPIERAAAAVNVPVERLRQWERGEAQPTIAQLRKLAAHCRKPLALLYLPAPPEPLANLPDLRRFLHVLAATDAAVDELPTEIHDALDDALFRRDVMIELDEALAENLPVFSCQIAGSDTPDRAAQKLREYLNVASDAHRHWSTANDARRFWFQRLENAGVLVFQFTAPLELARGFSIFEEYLPVISANSKDADVARIFTAIHELTHLASRSNHRTPREEEEFCNAVAGRVLVPRGLLTELLSYTGARRHNGQWQELDLSKLANIAKVSRETIARRLRDTGQMTDEEYDRWRQILNQPMPARRTDGGPNYYRVRVSQMGRHYAKRVISAYDRDHLTLARAARYLQVSVNQVSKVRDELG